MSSSRMLPGPAREALAAATFRYAEALMDDGPTLRYLAERGIEIDADLPVELGNPEMLGLVVDPIPEHQWMAGRLSVPYLTPRGPGPTGMKFRCLGDHRCSDHDHPKYLAHAGMGQRLYGVTAFERESSVIGIAEGELDAIVASTCGIPTVGVPGVRNWQPFWGYCFEGYQEVVIFGDGDQPGREFAERLAEEIPGSRAIHMPDGEDVSSLVVAKGRDALLERIG